MRESVSAGNNYRVSVISSVGSRVGIIHGNVKSRTHHERVKTVDY